LPGEVGTVGDAITGAAIARLARANMANAMFFITSSNGYFMSAEVDTEFV
jgi:hypothetical protein